VVGKGVFEPGWKWSDNVKPIAGTETCEVSHLGYVISGRMKIYADDGGEGEIGPGDVYALHPGHDAEVVGDEPCIALDLASSASMRSATDSERRSSWLKLVLVEPIVKLVRSNDRCFARGIATRTW
jgi:hypothetical protein